MLSYSVGYSTTKGHVSLVSYVALSPGQQVGVAGFEPAASSSRTTGGPGRLVIGQLASAVLGRTSRCM